VARPPTRHLVVVAFGYVLGAAFYARLPADVPPWGLGRGWLAFLLPTAAALVSALLRFVCSRDPLDPDDAARVLSTVDAIVFRVVLCLTGVHATVLLGLSGLLWGRAWVARIVPALVGTTLIAVGNVFPRTRPNRSIGVRTTSTLSNRRVWMRTQRAAGYLLVALGLVILVGAIAVPAPIGPKMGRLVEPAALFGIPALWFYSRRAARA